MELLSSYKPRSQLIVSLIHQNKRTTSTTRKCSTLWGAANAQFTSPARHDKRVLSVSCLACRCELALTDQIVSWCRQCRPIRVWKFRDRCVDDEARLENTTFRVGLNGSCCCCRWISRSKAVFKAHVTVRNITIDAILKQFHILQEVCDSDKSTWRFAAMRCNEELRHITQTQQYTRSHVGSCN